MAKRISGEIVHVGNARIKRGGDVTFDSLKFQTADGRLFSWSGMAMERPVAELMQLGATGTIYFSKTWSTIYGFRSDDGDAEFGSSFANPLMLLMAIGLLFGGLATSMFLFPLLVALAGLCGIFVCLDARRARRKFRRDGRRGRPTLGT